MAARSPRRGLRPAAQGIEIVVVGVGDCDCDCDAVGLGDGLVAVADGVGDEGGGVELCDGDALGLGCASASSLPAASSIAANRASVT